MEGWAGSPASPDAPLAPFFSALAAQFAAKESEADWDARDAALKALGGLAAGGAPRQKPKEWAEGMRVAADAVCSAAVSLRTALALTALATVPALAAGGHLSAYVEAVLPTLLKLTATTKKLVASAAEAAAEALLKESAPQHTLRALPMLEQRLAEKNAAARSAAAHLLRVVLDVGMAAPHARAELERSGMLDVAERCIRKALTDASPVARDYARACYALLGDGWPERSERLLDSLDAPTRKAVLRGMSGASLPSVPSRAGTESELLSPTTPRTAPAALATEPSAGDVGEAEPSITALLSSASPSSRARGVDAFLAQGLRDPTPAFPSAFLALLRAPDAKNKCLEALPALVEAGSIQAGVVLAEAATDTDMLVDVAASLGPSDTIAAIPAALPGSPDPSFLISLLLSLLPTLGPNALSGPDSPLDALLASLAPLASDPGAADALRALRAADRWGFERALRASVPADLFPAVRAAVEEPASEPGSARSTPLHRPSHVLAAASPSPSGSPANAASPAAGTASSGATPDFLSRIRSLAPRASLPPLPSTSATPARPAAEPSPFGVRIDERKFRLSLSFSGEPETPGVQGGEEQEEVGDGEGQPGWSLADELGEGWEMDPEPWSRRASAVTLHAAVNPETPRGSNAVGSAGSTPRQAEATPRAAVPGSVGSTPRRADGTPRAAQRTPASAASTPRAPAVAVSVTPAPPGGMVSAAASPERSPAVPATPEPATPGLVPKSPAVPTTPATPYMREESERVRQGAGYRDAERRKAMLFAQATPDPRSADADLDDVLMMLRAAGPGPRLLGTGWRKVLRLSEAARGKGKGVFGGHGAEIVEGVVREWEDLKEEGGEAAAWPVFALSVLAANQNPLVRSEPGLLGAVLGCFFSAFSADDPGVQASAYSGLLACLRRTDAAALASVCASWLEAPGWDAEPGSDSPAGRACPAWACLKVLALALDRFRTARERDPSAGPAPGLVSRAAMLMARALRSPDPLVRMAGTDVAVAVVALAGEEAIGVLGKGAQGEARKWVVRCAVELWERGEWRLGFAGSGR